MDDNGNNGLPPGGSEQSLSESHPAESKKAETSEGASTQTLTAQSNGSSQRKIEANRRNAKKSTGPKTALGKTISSWNSTRHGLLSQRPPRLYGRSKRHFTRLLGNLRQDLEPVGTLEEVLVEKIAQEYWRLGVAASYETSELERERPFATITFHRIIRYQMMINRQLFQAMNQLERLQRLRKGDNVPAPLNLQVLGDTTGVERDENLGE